MHLHKLTVSYPNLDKHNITAPLDKLSDLLIFLQGLETTAILVGLSCV